MTYTMEQKALAIHRVIECKISVRRGTSGMHASSDNVSWSHGEDLMLAIKAAFDVWKQRWRVQRERDIIEAESMDLDVTAVGVDIPREYYSAPESKASQYAEAYDVISKYRCQADFNKVGYVGSSMFGLTILGDGEDLIERALSFRDKMESRESAHKKELADRLGIN